MTKRLLIILAVTAFSLSLATTYVSAGMGEAVKGSVTKIEGSKVTISDAMGNEKTTDVKDAAALQNLKVGDRISIKDGMLTKESVESSAPEPSAPARNPKY
jgi:Flp pilus assembly protein TadD